MLASTAPRLLSPTEFGKANLDWAAGVQAPPSGLLAQSFTLGNRDGTARRRSARITPLVVGSAGQIVLYRLWLVWWLTRSEALDARADLCRLISLGAGAATAGSTVGDGTVVPANHRYPSALTLTLATDGNDGALTAMDAPAPAVVNYGSGAHFEVLVPDALGAAAIAIEISESSASVGNAIVESFT